VISYMEMLDTLKRFISQGDFRIQIARLFAMLFEVSKEDNSEKGVKNE
jgi:hypothetical protein